MAIALRNAVIVNEGSAVEGDVRIAAGRIDAVGGRVAASAGDTEIDLAGAWLLPGMIDDQVHFREPGFEHKADIATESRAAVAGGITSYMEMPNCDPQTVTGAALKDKHTRAASRSVANYAFYLGATNDNLDEIRGVDRHLACGVKVFMGASTGNMLVDDERTLEGIFAECPLLIATHCEDTPMILANEAAAQARYGDDIPIAEHANIRSAEACHRSSSLAVRLARKHGSRLHVLHITTARELALFEAGPVDSKRITAEACVHHLYFNETHYGALGADIKCNPAIKTRADQLAIRQAVNDDVIDVVATDHAPHTDGREGGALPAGTVRPAAGAARPALAGGTGAPWRDDHRAGGAKDRTCIRNPVRRGRTRLHSRGLPRRPDGDRSKPPHGGGRRAGSCQVRLDALPRHHLSLPGDPHLRRRPVDVCRRGVPGRHARRGAAVRSLRLDGGGRCDRSATASRSQGL